jgi:polyhydroxyalkanoate synthase
VSGKSSTLPLTAPAQEGAGIGAHFALPVDRFKDLRRAVETVFDPFGIVAPIVHAQFAWWSHPFELADLWMRSAADLAALAHLAERHRTA